jgi:hypothetical protein
MSDVGVTITIRGISKVVPAGVEPGCLLLSANIRVEVAHQDAMKRSGEGRVGESLVELMHGRRRACVGWE